MNILLIEDKMADAVLLEKLLLRDANADSPPHISPVGTVDEARAMLDSMQVHVLLLDLELSSGGPLANLRALRGIAPEQAIVAICGENTEEMGRTAVLEGADAFFVKRAYENCESLMQVVQGAIDQGRVDAPEAPRQNLQGHLRLDESGRIVEWDEACVEILQWPAADVANLTLAGLVLPSRRDEFAELMSEAEDNPYLRVETAMQAMDGQVRMIALQRGPEEDARSWQLAEVDASRRLLAAQPLLNAISMAATDAVISLDCEGHIQSWNNGAQRLLGYAAAEAVDKPVGDFLPDDALCGARGAMATVQRGQSVSGYSGFFLHRDGHQVPLTVSLTPLRDELGAMIGICCIARGHGARADQELSLLAQKQALQSEAEELRQLSESYQSRLFRAEKRLHGAQMMLVDIVSLRRRRFELKPYLDGILQTLLPGEGDSAPVALHCPAGLLLEGIPGLWARLLTQILSQTLPHILAAGHPARLRLSLTADQQQLELSFQLPEAGARASTPPLEAVREPVSHLIEQMGGRIASWSPPEQQGQISLSLPAGQTEHNSQAA